jgi:hypothetical protein
VTTTNQVCFRVLAKRSGSITAGTSIEVGREWLDRSWSPCSTAPPPTAPRTCRKTSAALAGEILSNPGRFYVNIHSRSFPDGAIRGQLIK